MDDLGARLRRAREERGIALKDIAQRTKISITALEALERSDFTRLPGGIFSRSFVRAYALAVGLDPDATLEEFLGDLRESERLAADRIAVRPEVTADDREFLERQRRALRLLKIGAAVVAVVVIAIAVWQLRAYRIRSANAAESNPLAEPAPPPPAAGTTPGATGEPAVTAAGPPAPVRALTIEITLTDDCWVAVTADGQAAVSRLFRAGEQRTFEGDREVILDVGNAGAIQWKINGKPAKPLGRAGVHVRTRIGTDNLADLLMPNR